MKHVEWFEAYLPDNVLGLVYDNGAGALIATGEWHSFRELGLSHANISYCDVLESRGWTVFARHQKSHTYEGIRRLHQSSPHALPSVLS